MRFTTSILLACSAALASAQVFFSMSTLPGDIAPGTNYEITWGNPTAGTDTVTIFLVQGDPSDLKTLMSIASGQPHTGSLSWTPSASLAKATNYAFKIVSDSNPNDFNYSGQFGISTDVTTPNTATIASTAGTLSTSTIAATSMTTGGTSTMTGSMTTTAASSSGTSSHSSATSSSSATRSSQSSTPVPTTNVGARSLKVGGGMLAAVAGVMLAL